MIGIFLSPRYQVEPSRTRNAISQVVRVFEEVAETKGGYGVCLVDADQETFDAIAADGRFIALTAVAEDRTALRVGLQQRLDAHAPVFTAKVRAALENRGLAVADSDLIGELIHRILEKILQAQRGDSKPVQHIILGGEVF